MNTRMFTMAACLALAPAIHAQTATPEPRTALEVIRRYVAAMGGDASAPYPTSTSMEVQMSMGKGGETRVQSYVRAPLVYTRTTMTGFGVIEAGYDGTTAWTLSEVTGPVILPESQATAIRASATPLREMLERSVFSLRGKTQLEGRTVYVVDAATIDSIRMVEYFDAQSGLLVGMDSVGGSPRDGKSMIAIRDYKRFGSVLVATEMVIRSSAVDSVVSRVLRVDHTPIPDSIFALPPAVKALKEGKAPGR